MELPKEQTTTIYLCGGIKLGTLWVKNQLFQTFWHFMESTQKADLKNGLATFSI